MTIRLTIFHSLLFSALLLFLPQLSHAQAANLLQDESFERNLAPEKGGWILFDESMFSSKAARSGQQSMLNWGFSRSVSYPPYFLGTVSGSYQEFAARPGSQWRLTGYGLTRTPIKGGPAFGIVQLSFFDDSGNDLGTLETAGSDTTKAKLSNEVNSQSPVGEWIFLDTGIATAPANTAIVQAFTLYVDFSGSDTSQGVHFDDLSLCQQGDSASSANCSRNLSNEAPQP